MFLGPKNMKVNFFNPLKDVIAKKQIANKIKQLITRYKPVFFIILVDINRESVKRVTILHIFTPIDLSFKNMCIFCHTLFIAIILYKRVLAEIFSHPNV